MKSKWMRKKMLLLLMVIMTLALTMTACGSEDDDDDDDRKSRKEQSDDDDDDDDDKKDKDKKKDDEDEPEATPEPTPEPTPVPTDEPNRGLKPEEVAWEDAYEDYFDNFDGIVEKNVSILLSGKDDGMYVEVEYGYTDDYHIMSIKVEEAYIEYIATDDTLMCYCEAGGEYITAITPLSSFSEVEALFDATELFGMFNEVEYEGYTTEYELAGVPYDCLEACVYDGYEWYDANFQINRDTQKVNYIDLWDEDGEYSSIEIIYMTKSEFNEIVESIMEDYDPDMYEVEEVTLQEMAEIYSIFLESAEGSGTQSEPEVGDTDDSEWATAYDDYFEDGFVLPESFEISMSIDMDGFMLDYTVTVADNGDTKYSYLVDGKYGVDAYTDGEIILLGSLTLPELGWALGELESEDQLEDIIGIDMVAEFAGETGDVSSVAYLGSVNEKGNVYDVLDVYDVDGECVGTVYINRDTQDILKFVMDIDGMEMTIMFTEFDEVIVPDEAREYELLTVDDLITFYEEAIITCVTKAMGVE